MVFLRLLSIAPAGGRAELPGGRGAGRERPRRIARSGEVCSGTDAARRADKAKPRLRRKTQAILRDGR